MAPDLGAANRPAVERERRDDDDIEPVALAERGEGVGRPATLEPERRVGGHEEAAAARPAPDPLDEGVVGRLPQGLVEVLDDGDLDPGRRRAAPGARPGRAGAAAPIR